jgi:predicted ATP-dependent serine protease
MKIRRIKGNVNSGKTTKLMMIADTSISNGKSVLFISNEVKRKHADDSAIRLGLTHFKYVTYDYVELPIEMYIKTNKLSSYDVVVVDGMLENSLIIETSKKVLDDNQTLVLSYQIPRNGYRHDRKK